MNQYSSQPQVTSEKKTVVLGATNNPSRYAYRAVEMLLDHGIEPVPVGIRRGSIEGIDILNDRPDLEDVHTVTLYLNPERQREYYDYIMAMNPKRIIFNPGTVNPELMNMAREKGIEVEVGCTLVMLSVGSY
ncbi:CoA-binding protein [Flavilitoribacter nigricans]|uniref:CoA-binding protein n=1 Tax=Flavilitoribacter nigricans (strain ATCC 23147 / DSM 23189 / NBRC 102662 / NCIMB 1420 / SS-2) TaxID=1122177 RepID=A0A2D0N9Z2_FLAN2|nr:CoA-binding protein [Flavilitoribacter nigricans]PHN05341.1 CoA-binding protein [Flavilitoribacter nigricans DSM 23189 = NBRC 102662]